jgi:pyruvate-formate lyase-activating enzyme
MFFTPYTRRDGNGITSIIGNRRYDASSPQAAILAQLERGLRPGLPNESLRALAAQPHLNWLWSERWLFATHDEIWRASRLRYASIETISACQQRCYFCPVSTAPRPSTRMPTELFSEILGQLAAIETVEAVFLNHYNEPFLDTRLPDMIRGIAQRNLKVGINTNAAVPFDAARWRGMEGMIALLTVNIHTLDRERYTSERGRDDLATVLANIELYMRHRIAADLRVVVLGHGDVVHDRDIAAVTGRFAGTGVQVMPHLLMDRCGSVQAVAAVPDRGDFLGGCEQTGSRVLEHIHVLTDGRCVLCCEDYAEKHIVGDLRTQSIAEVMRGEPLAEHRRKIYGALACEEGYICRACAYAVQPQPVVPTEDRYHHSSN